jgi:Protein of unknown function (DUF2846)
MKRLFLSGALWLYGALLIVQQTAPPTAASESSQTAHLRIYRQRRYLGWNLAPSIYVDDQQVVRVGNGSRVSIRLAAGPHSIRSDDKSSAIALDAKAGQEYFVRVDEETGFWKGHGRLSMLLPEQGGAEYKMQKPLEDDRRIANDLIEEDAATPSAK